MAVRYSIIVDIDNTILSQAQRKQSIIKNQFGIEINIDEIKKDFRLNSIFQTISDTINREFTHVKSEFENAFFSTCLYSDDNFDVMKFSNHYLNEINEYVDIIYLSSREEELYSITLGQLEHFGFPTTSNKTKLILAPAKTKNLDEYEICSFHEKCKAIKKIKAKQELLVSIGDNESDLAAAYVNGIQSILISCNYEETVIYERLASLLNENISQVDTYGVICLDNWQEIYNYILYSTDNSSQLVDICKTHSADYSSWLGDLDQKSALILIIGTFCATAFFSWIANGSFQNTLILILVSSGLVFSLLSMVLAIKSFSSRVTHSNELIRKLLPFIKPKRNNNFSPLKERNNVSNSPFSAGASLKYLKQRYGTLNPNGIMSKNLYSLRASNYEKIYPERYAKIALFISIGIIFIVALLSFIGLVFNNSSNSGSVESESHLQLIGVSEDKKLNVFDDNDILDNLSDLSISGYRKIAQIVNETDSNEVYILYKPASCLEEDPNILYYKNKIIITLIDRAIHSLVDDAATREVILINGQ